jgi:hypothetical protein
VSAQAVTTCKNKTIKEDVMSSIDTESPNPIVREERIRFRKGQDLILRDNRRQDFFNLSTGDVCVARIIAGARYDTTRATLVVGHGEYDGYSYTLWRLYRRHEGDFFTLRMQWAEGLDFVGPDFILPIAIDCVLMAARRLVRDEHMLEFVAQWYKPGWLPRDDTFMQEWAESRLDADTTEVLLDLLGEPRAVTVPALLTSAVLVEQRPSR